MRQDTETVTAAIKELEERADALDARQAAVVADAIADATATKERVLGALRARQAARLAGPSAALWGALYGVQQPPPRPTRTRKRRPSAAPVIRHLKQAGFEITGCDIQRDGTIKIITGKPVGTEPDDDYNEWDTVQ
jgi:hypothetical protein